MIPVTQFILGNSDPLLYPSEKMTNSIDEYEAKEVVEQMYHVKDNKKYVGEKI